MAIRYCINLFRVFIYYLFTFALCRLAFLMYFGDETLSEGFGSFFKSFLKALPLDTSAACYLLFVPAILLLAGNFGGAKKYVDKVLKAYLAFTALLVILLAASEIAVYREMHVKLYYHLLLHLLHPTELFRSVPFFLLLTIIFIAGVIGYACYLFIIRLEFTPPKAQRVYWWNTSAAFIVFILSTGLLVVGCRGGFQPIPINEGEVYFSRNQCLNDATVNPLWNIGHSYVENNLVLNGDAYKVMPDDEAGKIVTGLYSVEKDSSLQLLKTNRPNICFLILESWSADVIAAYGGYPNATPNFEKLVSEGYAFTNIISSGHVSDQGIPAILSGYPALPIGSAINQPERQVHLPCLTNEFKPLGYHSSFYFGGQLIYGSIKTYVFRNEFDKVVEQRDLPENYPAGRLGINDSVMLDVWNDSISRMQQPFFSALFTVSTHAPFDIPAPYNMDWAASLNPYISSIAYTDRQLGRFFEMAKKQPWFSNTLFVIIADHSHDSPRNQRFPSAAFYHIPLLFYGGALKDEVRGKRDERRGSQTDIASTLLHQLNLPDTAYRWSKNLANPYSNNFAFFTFDEGFGYTEGDKEVVWNKKSPKSGFNNGVTPQQQDSLYRKGAAMLQVLMKDFLSK